MPYVNIKITDEGVTEVLQKTLNKNPQTTVVVIDEVHTDN